MQLKTPTKKKITPHEAQRRVWLFYKFRILVNLVLNDPAPEPEANARKKSTEVPNKKPNEVVMSDAP